MFVQIFWRIHVIQFDFLNIHLRSIWWVHTKFAWQCSLVGRSLPFDLTQVQYPILDQLLDPFRHQGIRDLGRCFSV